MTNNVGTVDRVLRIVLGLALLSLLFMLEGGARWLGLLGIVPLLTGIAGSCPAYRLFGIRTAWRASGPDAQRRRGSSPGSEVAGAAKPALWRLTFMKNRQAHAISVRFAPDRCRAAQAALPAPPTGMKVA